MSAAVMGTRYSPPSPPETQSSSETMSPIYPERPIKPLPKRRLKDRLSSDAAETISWPPAPPVSNPLFYPSTYESNAQHFQQNMQNGAVPDIDKVLIDAQAGYPPKDAPYEFHGTDPVSDDETCRQETYRSHAIRAQSHSVTSAESDHGYDSFENSNNKKKRKIPTSSSNGVLHPSLAGISADMANMGISSATDGIETEDGGTQQYYGQGYPAVPISGTGISGAGRGRYGRSGRRDSRSPLSASANASNWQAGRMAGARHVSGKYAGKAEHGSESGIISQAIADAANSPLSLDKGQENISLLEQQQQRSTKKNTPAAQFTFNLDSEAGKGPAWPGDRLQSHYPSPPPLPSQQLPPNAKGYSQGTQTSPSMAGQNQQGAAAAPGTQPPAPPPKPRRPASVRYARAARHRKSEQEYSNFHNPPKPQDMWICEFCEYEAIFGHPPRALIRSYEAKDAKERRKQAEKKRLLEKAKSKGRKARKGTKAAKANAAAAAANNSNNTNSNAAPAATDQHQSQQNYANTGQPPDPHPQSDYYSGNEYEDDGDPPISTPTPPSKIPGPVNTPYGASQRPSGGTTAAYAEPRTEPRQRAAT